MVLEVTGQIKQSRVFVDEKKDHKYAYRIDKITTKKKTGENIYYLKCANKKKFKCLGRAKVVTKTDNVSEWILEETKEHNHEAEEHIVQIKELEQNIKDRVKNEATDMKKIFDEECNK